MNSLGKIERELDNFNVEERKKAFLELKSLVDQKKVLLPNSSSRVNLHYHTFFSFNAYGYSPLHIIWRARKEGLAMAGSVDFDVLDAMEEFLWGGFEVNLPVSSGIETRVYLPEFQDRELSSPKEPGVAYFMGNGFTQLPELETKTGKTLRYLKEIAQKRNRSVLKRVNSYLQPVTIDLEKDVLPLTPSGNPTERHLVMAYDIKADQIFPDQRERVKFWSEKLEIFPEKVEDFLNHKPDFYDFIRSKLMKHGGVGYVKPDVGDFPTLEQVTDMILDLGAIPSFSWLDGTRSGEKDPKELLDFCEAKGIETLFIVPDRNWDLPDQEERRLKLAKLYEIVEEAKRREFPIFVGTELNKFGQKFVDEFESAALAPIAPYFLRSAWMLWGHIIMERSSQRGYTSKWAAKTFQDRKAKNRFYYQIGQVIPADRDQLEQIGSLSTEELIKRWA
ncbi:hypothetical protein [Atribacter laminatus]|uniref:PHP domain-containing protein n=1 Tax=Atribacter laminatus TaxID=2847778 RepID=A0A7T1F2Q5_ATRLM|nr:hypothetical protein [Atribacter laminatus]QPM67555.1 hypothetical protein RT761_00758 [Atribacter laminatus]